MGSMIYRTYELGDTIKLTFNNGEKHDCIVCKVGREGKHIFLNRIWTIRDIKNIWEIDIREKKIVSSSQEQLDELHRQVVPSKIMLIERNEI